MNIKEYELATPYVQTIKRIQQAKAIYVSKLKENPNVEVLVKDNYKDIADAMIDAMDDETAKLFLANGIANLSDLEEKCIKQIESISVASFDIDR